MKNLFSITMLGALAIAVVAPADLTAQYSLADLKQRALGVIDKAKALNPDPTYWKDKTVEKAKHMWNCVTGSSKCSQAEITKARTWVAGTSAVVLTALLIAAGIVVSKSQVEKVQSQEIQKPAVLLTDELVDVEIPANATKILAAFIEQEIPANKLTKISDFNGLSTRIKDNIRYKFGRLFPQHMEQYAGLYKDNGDIKGQLYNQAIEFLKNSSAQ